MKTWSYTRARNVQVCLDQPQIVYFLGSSVFLSSITYNTKLFLNSKLSNISKYIQLNVRTSHFCHYIELAKEVVATVDKATNMPLE